MQRIYNDQKGEVWPKFQRGRLFLLEDLLKIRVRTQEVCKIHFKLAFIMQHKLTLGSSPNELTSLTIRNT